MIVGLGIDVVELDRIENALEKHGRRFLERILVPDELAALPKHPVPYVAARFAAKEAAVKALGTGFSNGVTFRDVEVVVGELGKPELAFHGQAAKIADSMRVIKKFVSLSHGRDSAVAVVVLEGFMDFNGCRPL